MVPHFMAAQNTIHILLRKSHINLQPGHTDRITAIGEGDPALAIRYLLAMVVERIAILATICRKEGWHLPAAMS